MRAFFGLVHREFLRLFSTALGWVLFTGFVLFSGITFVMVLLAGSAAPEPTLELSVTQALFGHSVFVPLSLLFLCPALTMRSFAEERRMGTLDILLASPVGTTTLVLAKFTALLGCFVLFWLPTLFYYMILARTGQVELWVWLGCTVTIWTIGAALLAVGLWVSAWARSQVVALIITSLLVLGFLLLSLLEQFGVDSALAPLLDHVSIQAQLREASQGILALGRLVFDVSLIVLGLVATTLTLTRGSNR